MNVKYGKFMLIYVNIENTWKNFTVGCICLNASKHKLKGYLPNNENGGLGMKEDAEDCKEALYVCSISREAVMDHD